MTREELRNYVDEQRTLNNIPYHVYSALIDGIDTLEQEPKIGHWIDIMVGDMPAQACDQCNTFYPLSYTGGGHNYCPSCGAKMVEPQESEETRR